MTPVPGREIRSLTSTARWAGALWAVALAFAPNGMPGEPAPSDASTVGKKSVGKQPKPATMHVRGYGLLGNLRLKQQLRVLRSDRAAEPLLDSFVIEDATVLLLSGLQAEGYLRPGMEVEIQPDTGTTATWPCGYDQALELPRSVRARRVTFHLHPGTFYHYARVEFHGLTAIPEPEATTYFLVPNFLLPQKQPKVYTPARLDRSLANLREALRRLGYREAAVDAKAVELNHATGEVVAMIGVTESRRYWVSRVETHTRTSANDPSTDTETKAVHEAFSGRWEQDLIRSLKVGRIRFQGLDRTRESLLRRRTRFEVGDPLNRLAVEAARFQMLRLGIFDRGDAEILPMAEDAGLREVRYDLQESKPVEFSVLVGYGSYELLRAGLELEQLNLLGLAHRQRLLAAQSFKSTKLEYSYTIPQVFSPLGDLTGLGYFRQREETTFTRRDYGGSLGYLRLLPGIQSELGVRLAYEQLNTRDDEFNPDYGLQEASVSSVGVTFDRNRTDNPLDPQSGHRVYATLELATEALGGSANYGRVEVGASAHLGLTRSLLLRGGISHAVVVTPGDVRDDLPFNKRFFLGGASSVRGYVEGEAASFDPSGKLVGDESYLLGQVELEQRITSKWSLVGFLDVAGLARDIADYPANEVLASIGAGVRWRTPIGPVRLEYGYNLHRRDPDPVGSLHLSVGYPF